MPPHDPAAVESLFSDWSQFIAKSNDVTRTSGCLNNRGFSGWLCCPEHRALRDAHDDLSRRAFAIHPAIASVHDEDGNLIALDEKSPVENPSCSVLSEHWWNDVGVPSSALKDADYPVTRWAHDE